MHILHLEGVPIFRQLQIEEALLRTDLRNICLINTKAPKAIVMGISGKPEKLIDISLAKKNQIPVIQRFSGGGTVIIDEGTLFITFIGNASDFSCEMTPSGLMHWSAAAIYQPLFPNVDFQLRENDYCIGDKKIGGNAQYLRKERFLHHTSFLWDFEGSNMNYLLMPEKRPAYRKDRTHLDFLSMLSSHFPCRDQWIATLKEHLKATFSAQQIDLSSILEVCNRPHRQATNLCSFP